MIEFFEPDFVAEHYRTRHPDLRRMSDIELKAHFDAYGRDEGRGASASAGRDPFVAAFAHARRALEIGPFANPMLTPGPNRIFVDVLDTEGLVARAKALGLDSAKVPPIDHALSAMDLSEVDGEFDLVASSHCIEHQPDLVAHVKAVERKLAADGVYALLVPDCRYCFDHFLPPSNIAEVLLAHRERRTRHTLAKVIEHRALTTHNDSRRHWAGDHGGDPLDIGKVRAALAEYDASGGAYIDVHGWQFTPSSFRRLFNALADLGVTLLRPARVYDTLRDSNEFCAVLMR